MPFQAGICESCEEYDYLECVEGKKHCAWLCRYCRETLEEEGVIDLKDGKIIELERKEDDKNQC